MTSSLPLITEPEHLSKHARADVAQGFGTQTSRWDEEGAVEETGECEGVLEGDALIVQAAVGEIGEVVDGGVGAEGVETCVGFVEGVEGDVEWV